MPWEKVEKPQELDLVELRSALRELHDIHHNAISRLAAFGEGLEDQSPRASNNLRHYLAGPNNHFSLHSQVEAAWIRIYNVLDMRNS